MRVAGKMALRAPDVAGPPTAEQEQLGHLAELLDIAEAKPSIPEGQRLMLADIRRAHAVLVRTHGAPHLLLKAVNIMTCIIITVVITVT